MDLPRTLQSHYIQFLDEMAEVNMNRQSLGICCVDWYYNKNAQTVGFEECTYGLDPVLPDYVSDYA